MQRPSPLPAPPTRADAAGAGADAPEDELAPLQMPIAPGSARPTPPPAVPEQEADRPTFDAAPGDDRGAEPEDGIGVREVWAAARARRKALRAEVRRFTARQRRRRMTWIAVAGAIVVLVLGTLGAAYSPLFAVDRIEVVGTSSLSASDVEEALADQLGTPLPLVDSSAVKAALVQFPLVESYALEARPPHELVVRIVERTPIGFVESAAGYTVVDAAGVALSTTDDPPKDQPEITADGGVGSSAFRAIGTVFRALPADIRDQVTAMTATTANDVTLTLGDTKTDVVWGNADRSAYKAVVLDAMMKAKPPTKVDTYDVSSPETVVVR